MRKGTTKTVALPVETNDEELNEVNPHSFNTMSLETLMQTNFPPPSWVVPGLIPEGMGLIVAPPKTGKSWFSLDLSMAVATGGNAFGQLGVTEARPVIYFAMEDNPRRLKNRLTKLGHAIKPGADWQAVYEQPQSGDIIPGLQEWLEQRKDQKPLVVIDTLGRAGIPTKKQQDGYERDTERMTRVHDLIRHIPGACVILVHHTNKRTEGGDTFDSISGTQGILGAADWSMMLRRTRQQKEARLTITGRDVEEAEYLAEFSDNWQLRLKGGSLHNAAQAAAEAREQNNLGENSAAILKHLEAHPGEALSARELKEATATSVTVNSVTASLKRLADSGSIEKVGRGIYRAKPKINTTENDTTL